MFWIGKLHPYRITVGLITKCINLKQGVAGLKGHPVRLVNDNASPLCPRCQELCRHAFV